ncbi:MAG: sigma 54-interacting transcriptional regulator [Pirellulaceae bacterium]|nr:sigma 54-interacting transcriptional regulator [Pirellulaceae bacterium]
MFDLDSLAPPPDTFLKPNDSQPIYFQQRPHQEPLSEPLSSPPSRFEGQQLFLRLTTENHNRPLLLSMISLDSTEWPLLNRGFDLEEANPTAKLHQQIQKRLAYRLEEDLTPYLLGESALLKRVITQLHLAAESKCHALITGESGTPKELLAQAICQKMMTQGGDSPLLPETAGENRPSIPFSTSSKDGLQAILPLACSDLTAQEIQESVTTLLRYCKELETDSMPILLLKDLETLPLEAQQEVLGFLSLPETPFRLLATSTLPPKDLTDQLGFSLPLLTLLSTLVLELPPLRDLRDDLRLICQGLIEQLNLSEEKSLSGLTEEAQEYLFQYDWPENYRELKETIQQAHHKASGPWITTKDLPETFAQIEQAAADLIPQEEPIALDLFLEEVEHELFRRSYDQAKGNKAQAARLLNISRPRFLRRWEYFTQKEKGEAGNPKRPTTPPDKDKNS